MGVSKQLAIFVFSSVGVFVELAEGLSCYQDLSYNDTERNDTSRKWACCEDFGVNPSTGYCEIIQKGCVNGCVDGSCTNGFCICRKGWYDVEGVCKPICTRKCQKNAYCLEPDVCECRFGWEESPDGECRPICPSGCPNGDCIAPKVCECRSGYILNERRQRCDPVCEGGCLNGECTSPEICTCNQGYVNSQHDRNSCAPDCGSENCNVDRCISPVDCICQQGYVTNSVGNCIPECGNGCPANAQCISPEHCACDDGFQMDDVDHKCVPLPGADQHEDPNAPLVNSRPGCLRPCINGVCMGYNTCSCKKGYVKDPQDLSGGLCEPAPSCPDGCLNGSCFGPNYCICNPGYIKDRTVEGSQRCIPRHN